MLSSSNICHIVIVFVAVYKRNEGNIVGALKITGYGPKSSSTFKNIFIFKYAHNLIHFSRINLLL